METSVVSAIHTATSPNATRAVIPAARRLDAVDVLDVLKVLTAGDGEATPVGRGGTGMVGIIRPRAGLRAVW